MWSWDHWCVVVRVPLHLMYWSCNCVGNLLSMTITDRKECGLMSW